MNSWIQINDSDTKIRDSRIQDRTSMFRRRVQVDNDVDHEVDHKNVHRQAVRASVDHSMSSDGTGSEKHRQVGAP